MKKYGLIITLIIVGLLQGCNSPLILHVKDKSITLELGDTLEITSDNLIDKDHYNQDDYKKIKKECIISNNIDFNNVGKYTIKLKYLKQNIKIKVKIVDTTKPLISAKENIVLNTNSDLTTIDFSQYLNITELSPYELSYDYSDINLNSAGIYHLIIKCVDSSNNESSLTTDVIVNQIIDNPSTSTPDKKQTTTPSSKPSPTPSSPSNPKPTPSTPSPSNPETPDVEKPSQPSGHYVTYYYCINHFKETYRKYTSLQQLIDAGHYTGGCGCNNYGYGEEWVND